MPEPSIIVPLRYDRKGQQLLSYGVDLANRMERPMRFGVRAGMDIDPENEQARLRENRCMSMLALAGANRTIHSYMSRATHDPHQHIRIADKSHVQSEEVVCVPFDEKEVAPHWRGKVMVPFGDGESGRYAFDEAVSILQALRLPILFWHTTWRRNGLESENAMEHMCDAALDNLCELEKSAREHGLTHSISVEMTDSVVHGGLLTALKQCCRLMVVARGKQTGKGSYVDQWLGHSTVPMLIMGRPS